MSFVYSCVLRLALLVAILSGSCLLQAREKFDHRAEVIIDGAAIYSLPNFDATIVNYLDYGQKIYTNNKAHNGEGGLGRFYKIKAKGRVMGFVADVDIKILTRPRRRQPNQDKKAQQDKKTAQKSRDAKKTKKRKTASQNEGETNEAAKKEADSKEADNKAADQNAATNEDTPDPLEPIADKKKRKAKAKKNKAEWGDDDDDEWGDDDTPAGDLFSSRIISAVYQPRVFFKSGPNQDKIRLHHVLAVQWHEPSIVFKQWPLVLNVAYGLPYSRKLRDGNTENIGLWVFSLATGVPVLNSDRFMVQFLVGPSLRLESVGRSAMRGLDGRGRSIEASPATVSTSFFDNVGVTLTSSAVVRVAGPVLLRADVAYHVRDFQGTSPLVVAAGLAYSF